MIRILAIFIVLTPLCTKLQAQEIVTERPDQTESSTTIPVKSLQMEVGFLGGSDNNENKYLLPTALFRYGLSRSLELRLAGHIAGINDKLTSKSYFGLIGTELGVKIQILNREGVNTRIAYIYHLLIPSGPSDIIDSHPGMTNKFALSHDLNEFLKLSYNIGYNYSGTGSGDLIYSVALGVGLSDKFGFYIEPFGAYSEFKNWISNFDAGFTYLLKDNLQLDISYGSGLNQKMHYLSLGFSWNIDTSGKPAGPDY